MNQLTAGMIVVIGVLGGFYLGAKYGQGHPTPSATPVAAATAGAGTGTGRFAGGGGGVGGGAGGGGIAPAVAGTITAVNGTTITVTDRTGRAVKVDVSGARITRTQQGTAADLTENATVTVVGQTGADGTVTAQTVAIGGGVGGGRQRQPSPSPSA